MKRLIFAASLFYFALTYHEAKAQGLWYVLPGDDYSGHYGLDLGNGVGFGDVVGYGFAGPNDPVLGQAAAILEETQGQFSPAIPPQAMFSVKEARAQRIQLQRQRNEAYFEKQRALKLRQAKRAESSMSSLATPKSN